MFTIREMEVKDGSHFLPLTVSFFNFIYIMPRSVVLIIYNLRYIRLYNVDSKQQKIFCI